MGMGGSGQRSSARRVAARARSHGRWSEINVTPFVDVMLVLLIIFMVTAPLLTVGVPVDLPKTQASRSTRTDEPITDLDRGQGAGSTCRRPRLTLDETGAAS